MELHKHKRAANPRPKAKTNQRHTNTEKGRSGAGKLRATGMSVFKRQVVLQGCTATRKDSLGLRSHQTKGHTEAAKARRVSSHKNLPSGLIRYTVELQSLVYDADAQLSKP